MNRPLRRGLIGLTSLALAAGGVGLVPTGPAAAAPASDARAAAATSVTDATFAWDLNNEATSGAFAPGTWNLMSAGRIGDPGAGGTTLTTASGGQTWSNGAPAGWSAQAGDVTVQDLQASGGYAPATFGGTRTNTAGANANTNGVRGETRLLFSDGVGTVDPDAGTATITWDGDATLLAYSGMTFFYLSDPELTVAADGTGTVEATVGGYATAMDDPEKWEALPETTVTVATLTGVDVTTTGIATTPAYREVPYTAPEGATAQNRSSATWGSFPQSFVDVQQTVGQGSYWYSSGGSADARKVANPLAVAYDVTPAAATPQVEVSRTRFLPSGAQEVTVTGTGFDPAAVPATRPPFGPSGSGGVYVAVGAFAPTWRPSEGAASSSRKTTSVRWAVPAAQMATIGGSAGGAAELTPEGTFSTTLVVDKAALEAATAAAPALTGYGVYTYPGGGASNASFETATPIDFAAAVPRVTVSSPARTFGQAGTATVGVVGATADGAAVPATGTVTLTRAGTRVGTATLSGGRATFDLGRLPAGRHALAATYSGEANVLAGSASITTTVAKAASTTRPRLVRKPTLRKAGRVSVALSSPTTAPTGKVVVTVRKVGGRVVTKATPTLTRGSVTVGLPKAARGSYRVVARYVGTADVAASTRTLTYRIR